MGQTSVVQRARNPGEQRPIMFLMFGLRCRFPQIFAISALVDNSPRQDQPRLLSLIAVDRPQAVRATVRATPRIEIETTRPAWIRSSWSECRRLLTVRTQWREILQWKYS